MVEAIVVFPEDTFGDLVAFTAGSEGEVIFPL